MGLMRDLLMSTRISSDFDTIKIDIDYDFELIEDENYHGCIPPVYDFNGYDVFCNYLANHIPKVYKGKFVVQILEVGNPQVVIHYVGDKPNIDEIKKIIEIAKKETDEDYEEYLSELDE